MAVQGRGLPPPAVELEQLDFHTPKKAARSFAAFLVHSLHDWCRMVTMEDEQSDPPTSIEHAARRHNVDPDRAKAWDAWSNLFLDSPVDDSCINYIAWLLAATPFSIAEIRHILKYEVEPACIGNLFLTAGQWAGFDAEWLVTECAKHQRAYPYPKCANKRRGIFLSLASLMMNHTALERDSVIAQVEQSRVNDSSPEI